MKHPADINSSTTSRSPLERAFWLAAWSASALSVLVTYFSALAQYATQDQVFHLQRIRAFLGYVFYGGPPYLLKYGSHLAFWIIGIPGHLIEIALRAAGYRLGETLVGDWQWTETLPFALVSCVWSLVGMFAIWRLFLRELGPTRHRAWFALVAFWACFHFPWFKAVAKLLKYDSIFWVMSTLALFLYPRRRRLAWGMATLAFLEKESGMTTLAFLGMMDYVRFGLGGDCRRAARAHLGAAGIFFGVAFLAMPLCWRHPMALLNFLGSQKEYLTGQSMVGLALAGGLWAVGIWFASRARESVRERWARWRFAATPVLLVLAFGLAGLAIASQRNWIALADSLPPGADADAVHTGAVAVGAPIYGYRLTTFDTSLAWTKLRVWLSEWRVIFYSLPEALWLPWLLLFLAWARGRRPAWPVEGVAYFAAAAVVATLGIAQLLIIFQARYLASFTFLVILISLALLAGQMETWSRAQVRIVGGAMLALLMVPAFSLGPTYFGYFNLARDARQENADAKKLGALEWTWSGCGESSYLVQEAFLKKLPPRDHAWRVLYDSHHVRTFDAHPGVEFVDPRRAFSAEELAAMAGPRARAIATARRVLARERIDFVVVSKVRELLMPLVNHWVVDFRDSAAYVDIRRGVEYAWAFAVPALEQREDSDVLRRRRIAEARSAGL